MKSLDNLVDKFHILYLVASELVNLFFFLRGWAKNYT